MLYERVGRRAASFIDVLTAGIWLDPTFFDSAVHAQVRASTNTRKTKMA
jgi:hypothetical protein